MKTIRDESGIVFPDVEVRPAMVDKRALLTMHLCQDLQRRKTNIAGYALEFYARDGYGNNAFATVLQLAAEYVEYLMLVRGSHFHNVVHYAVSIINDCFIGKLLKKKPRSQKLVNDNELYHYQSAEQNSSNLDREVKMYLNQHPSQVPMQPVYPNQQGQQPYPQQGYPQQQAYYPQQVPQGYYPQQGYPQQQYPQQNPLQGYVPQSAAGARLIEIARRREMESQQLRGQGYPQQQQGYYPQQPQYQQGYVPQQRPSPLVEFMNQQNQFMMPQTQYQQPQQAYYPQQRQQYQEVDPSLFMSTQPQQQQQYTQPVQQNNNQPTTKRGGFLFDDVNCRSISVDDSSIPMGNDWMNPSSQQHQPVYQEPTPTEPYAPAINFANQNVPDMGGKNRDVPYNVPAHLLDSTELNERVAYESSVRKKAKEMGLPFMTASIDFLESEIVRLDPNQSIVSPRSAYNERRGTPVQEFETRPLNEVIKDGGLKVEKVDDFEEWLKTDPNPTGRLVENPDGFSSTWVSGAKMAKIEEQARLMNLSQEQVDILVQQAAKQDAPPYPFCVKDSKGRWAVTPEGWNLIPRNKKGVFKFPGAYEFYTCDPYYIVDNNGNVINFISVLKDKYRNMPEGKILEETLMNYDEHSIARFLTPQSKVDVMAEPDMEATLKAFALAQSHQRIEEVVRSLEQEANVVKEDEVPMIVNKSITLDEQVNGGKVGDDYWLHAINGVTAKLAELDEDIEIAESAVQYTHVYMHPWVLAEEAGKLAMSIRFKEDYEDVRKLLIEMLLDDTIPDSYVTTLNDVVTKYVNHVLDKQMDSGLRIDSFLVDWDDLKDELEDQYIYGAFAVSAAKLCKTLLYPLDNSHPSFANYFDKDSQVEGAKAFGIIRDVNLIPIYARHLALHGEGEVLTVTKEGHKTLFKTIDNRFKNISNRVAEVLFVTQDNRVLYAHQTEFPDVYLLTKTGIMD